MPIKVLQSQFETINPQEFAHTICQNECINTLCIAQKHKAT